MSYVLGSGDGWPRALNMEYMRWQTQQQQQLQLQLQQPHQHQQHGSNNKDSCPVRQYEEPLLSRRSYRVTHFMAKFHLLKPWKKFIDTQMQRCLHLGIVIEWSQIKVEHTHTYSLC